MPPSFFTPLDDGLFSPTDYTIGPWSREAQHGGPPAALLGRAIEKEAGPEKQVVRVVFDILKPVPLTPLRVETKVVRPGKRVALIESSLSSEQGIVMRASGWALRVTELELPEESVVKADPPPGPEGYADMNPSDITTPLSYLHATEWRFVRGGFFEPGPAIAWLRTVVPLVEGEEDSPLVRVLAVADSASGVSGALDFAKWLYINTDLSVYLHRMPEGPWILVDAITRPGESGVAVATADLSDERGHIGASSQALLIDPR